MAFYRSDSSDFRLHFATIGAGSSIRIADMSISSVPASSPTPVNYNYPDPSKQTPAPAAPADSNSSEAVTSQPVQPPLPPGQGTRVNQLV
jgi:hypothetical protein